MGLLLLSLLAAAPASGLEPFFFFVGDWTCSGDAAAEWSWSVARPDSNGEIVGAARTESGGDELKLFRDTFSYSGKERKLMHVVVFTAATGVEALTTEGWVKDRLVFTGDLRQASRRVNVRETFRRWGDDGFTQTREQQAVDGTWKAVGTANCKRRQ